MPHGTYKILPLAVTNIASHYAIQTGLQRIPKETLNRPDIPQQWHQP